MNNIDKQLSRLQSDLITEMKITLEKAAKIIVSLIKENKKLREKLKNK